uniref:Uncharacterized protein n=1 Tax=viral metagenome TaxID=1070528 RepID=A0A6C0K1J8_9ZZZZ
MPEFMKNYNINSLYVCVILLLYNTYKSNFEYVNIILGKLYLFNYTSVIIIINIIGLYLFLKNLSFELNVKFSVKYE